MLRINHMKFWHVLWISFSGHPHASYLVSSACFSFTECIWQVESSKFGNYIVWGSNKGCKSKYYFSGPCLRGFVDVSNSIQNIVGCGMMQWSTAGMDTFDECSDKACRDGRHAFVIIDDLSGTLSRRCLFYRCQPGAVVTNGGCFDANFVPNCIATWILQEYMSWILCIGAI